jgi:hypothetical protein
MEFGRAVETRFLEAPEAYPGRVDTGALTKERMA